MSSDLDLLWVETVNVVFGTYLEDDTINLADIKYQSRSGKNPKSAFPVITTFCWYVPWLFVLTVHTTVFYTVRPGGRLSFVS